MRIDRDVDLGGLDGVHRPPLGETVAYLFLPESLVPANRKRFRLTEGNPVGAFVVLARYPSVFAVLTVFVLANIGERLLEANWVLSTGYRYGWGPADVGISLAVFGVLFALVQGGLVRVVVPLLGEVRTIAFGLAVGAIALVLFAAAMTMRSVHAPDLEVRQLTMAPLHQRFPFFSTVPVLKHW